MASAPDQTTPVLRLKALLMRDHFGDPGREAARMAMSPELERVALSGGWPASARLSAIADLARVAHASALPVREREIVIVELSRLALRILWWEGLLGPGIAPEAPADVAAAALVELCAAGLLPEGPACWMVLGRAKELLKRSDVVHALRENAPRRDRLLVRLVEAEARMRPLEV